MHLHILKQLKEKMTILAFLLWACIPLTVKAQQNTRPVPLPSASQPSPVSPVANVGTAAWKCLTDGLAEEDSAHRADAISALGTIGVRPDVVRLIESGLIDKSVTVRQRAATTLGDMKSRGSIPKLYTALDDDSPSVVYAAVTALWAMNNKRGEDILIEILQGDRKVLRGTVEGGLHYANKKLHDPSALAQIGVERAVGSFFGPAGLAVTLAEELAKDKTAPARANSARLLGTTASVESRDALEQALQDKSWIVRSAATEALGLHGSRSNVAKLAALLEDDHHEVRYKAAASIVRISSSR